MHSVKKRILRSLDRVLWAMNEPRLEERNALKAENERLKEEIRRFNTMVSRLETYLRTPPRGEKKLALYDELAMSIWVTKQAQHDRRMESGDFSF